MSDPIQRPSNRRAGLVRPFSLTVMSMHAALLLAACGGGGGGGGNDPPPAPAPVTTNAAPTVQAGTDVTIELPVNTVALQGSASDDGLPTTTLTYAWTVTSGAGVTFDNAAAAATTAHFTAAGTYVLTLTVSDSALSGSDTVQVVVGSPANAAPVVQAGSDAAIELPASTVALQGSATDDGQPTTNLTYAWTVTSGTGVTFDDAAAAATTARFSAAGTYELTLTASDSALSGSDTLQVVVNPPVFPTAGWVAATPAEMKMDAAKLDQARDFALTGAGSGFVTRHGRVVYTWGSTTLRYELKSTAKSIGGMALGLAIDDGRLQLADLAQTHLSTVGVPPDSNIATGYLGSITVLQLATHTAGFAKDGGYVELIAQPGTTWSYSDASLNWLADVLTQVYGQDLNTLLFGRAWTAMGITDASLRWRDNAFRDDTLNGIKRREFASGINASVDAMARVGYLFLRRGLWGDQRLLSESFVDTVQKPRPELASPTITIADPVNFPRATTNYGVLWWTNAEGLLADVPRDAFWAWGLGDSLIVVIPSLDIVVARAGNVPPAVGWRTGWNGDYSVLAPFLTPIVQSVTDAP